MATDWSATFKASAGFVARHTTARLGEGHTETVKDTIVWALPLLWLVFVTYFGSALTREIVLDVDSSAA